MPSEWKYRGRLISPADIESIRRLIATNPESSRWALSRKLCEDWNWRQPNGALRDMVCRGLLLMLERNGEVELPPVRRRPPGRPAKPKAVAVDDRPVSVPLSQLGPLIIEQVRRTPQEALFNSLMDQYHYLGYEQPVGEHLKYLVSAQGQAIACLAWSSSPRHLGCRDRFIGWGMEARRRNIHLLAYNTRFLILPWVTVPHLASHLLGRMARQIAGDWQRLYAHPVYLLETFIDPERFRGTCYRAANWIPLGRTTGRGKNDLTHKPNRSIKEVLALPLHRRFRALLSEAGLKRRRVEVNIGELDRLLEGARQAPLSDPDYEKISTALHALVDALAKPRSTEKSGAVVGKKNEASGQAETGPSANPDPKSDHKPSGHGRNGANAFESAKKVEIQHPQLKSGDSCPACPNGKVYEQKEPKVLIRIVGQAPIQATVYRLERLRCNLCGQVFTAEAPEGVGADKYDETVSSMVAQLKYGSGMAFNRLEKLEERLGVPLPATTQWEIVEEAAEVVKPAHEELIRQGAQGEILHNDDTGMKILQLQRPDGDTRTGVFTSGIVSIRGSDKIALFFTGRQHAGENLADVLKHRASGLSAPIQMCDALSRNTSKLSAGAEALIGFCLAHGRRQFVDVAENFPDECRYVLETLGAVYGVDAEAREQGLSWEARLQLHQEKSGPLMEALQQWIKEQLDGRKTEPNSGLGKALKYLQRHWHQLTLFLRQAGAPLDNNICERALKMVVLLRKNALFYRTQHGADVGDLFTSLIHTCDLNQINSFDYLTELQRHAAELKANPSEWMPWNYRATLARLAGS